MLLISDEISIKEELAKIMNVIVNLYDVTKVEKNDIYDFAICKNYILISKIKNDDIKKKMLKCHQIIRNMLILLIVKIMS